MDMHHSFSPSAEWRAARESELEFIEMARAIRDLARELGIAPDQAVDRLAERGLHAALSLLAEQAGPTVEARFLQRRAQAATTHRPL
ncbi:MULTISPECIES: hypothetical protein [unclassified Novosphingobium]|uniref:hypothetical protein n=1 Tax=unclassified Novosphingobium TaxID=2644732 RepID=UPI0003B5EF53|nr:MULTISPECIES: hypothetical protein [unclassified Novosphingobium]KPF52402.1 hypothetical protein IP65_16775 [Novosphingobium sp. AAP1]MBB3360170.1 hypothetical protein [Novosphingobium sp. BK256]MBB3376651.1 hypothetical protein [Novosphingobium sp. BK280]MBB3381064.1 hypothetical protein [Novosphingobium sp. BK258]MBB3422715.1 hypothetical protein [Novosphingobium sp. BK267]